MADAKDQQPQMVDINDLQIADVNDQQPLMEVEDGYAQLKSRVDELEKELQRKCTETDKALAQLRTELGTKRRFKVTERLAEENFNFDAQVSNSNAKTEDYILRPLKNTTTHETVFLPPTLGDFLALTEREVEQLLRALGDVPKGIAVEDFAALARRIGMSSIVVRSLCE
ncbi:hypothetical protein EV127DRAFT_468016 [Xylaria flabelliformis]|nr:hypothetical protein EV127DRAFT_468016 [Xylaria flabelliformis]